MIAAGRTLPSASNVKKGAPVDWSDTFDPLVTRCTDRRNSKGQPEYRRLFVDFALAGAANSDSPPALVPSRRDVEPLVPDGPNRLR